MVTATLRDGTQLSVDYSVQHGSDFAQSGYCFDQPKIQQITNATYIIDPMTSTKAAQVPAQGSKDTNQFALLRIGVNDATHPVQRVIDGLTLVGTNQGHLYHGYALRYGAKDIIRNSKFIAASWGNYNSSPGETFAINALRDVDSYISNVEVDGRLPDGTRVGGSPMGFNGSTRPVIEDSYLHHSLVSSLTFSIAGSTASPTDSPTTRRVRIEHNANTKIAAGFTFPAINHEHVIGTITHELPKLQIDWSTWDACHLKFFSALPSAKIVISVNPDEISGGPANHLGALTVQVPKVVGGITNTQKLTDISVVDQNGKALQPYVIYAQPTGPLPINRYTHFVINNS